MGGAGGSSPNGSRPSQHETFDPKPDAPEGIRGEYGTTQTQVPGVNFCEYLPKQAAMMLKSGAVGLLARIDH